eukprot:PhF_6_TR6118/c2_g1_i1/m.9035/K01613/psd, PISD; phosphatidylserine decarboxylase
MSNISSTSLVSLLDSIREDNAVRTDAGRVWTFWIYFVSVWGLVFYTMIPTVMSVYTIPLLYKRWRYQQKRSATVVPVGSSKIEMVVDLRSWSLFFGFVCYTIQFVVSVVGGLPGWTVVNFVFLLYVLILCIVMCCKRESKKNEEPIEEKEVQNEASVDGINVTVPEPIKSTTPETSVEFLPASWTSLPQEMSFQQKCVIIGATCGTLLCFIILIIVSYTYTANTYKVLNRAEMSTLEEYQPQSVAMSLQLMYSYPRFATLMRLAFYAKLMTNYCGQVFTKTVDVNDRRAVLFDDWINRYSINMTEYVPSNFEDYQSVNEWFIRKLRPGSRPMDPNPNVIVSPADARMVAFYNLADAKLWVKGDSFDVPTMLGRENGIRACNDFNGGAIVVARLAPQDYHRFHAPVSGYILEIQNVKNTYWSVSADAARSDNDVFYNTRQIIIIDAGVAIGKVAYVAIGATCVGSVVLQQPDGSPLTVGSKIVKGQELGYMQFGGSTVVLVFQAGMVQLDSDLLRSTRFEVETYIKVNQSVGQPVQAILEGNR